MTVEARVEFKDEVGPFLKVMQRTLPEEYRRSLFGLGGFFRKRVKEAFATGKAGHVTWPPGSGLKVVKSTGLLKRRRSKRQGGRLSGPIGFRVDKSALTVRIGWLSKSAAVLGDDFERGQRTEVTEKTRARFFAAGLALSRSTETVRQPKRPIFVPVLKRYGKEIPVLIEKGIEKALVKSESKAKRAARVRR